MCEYLALVAQPDPPFLGLHTFFLCIVFLPEDAKLDRRAGGMRRKGGVIELWHNM